MKRGINWKVLLLSLLIVFVVSLIGSLFTAGNTNSSWYFENKPIITPPNWIFAPVWTTLYLLIALSLYFALTNANKIQKKKVVVIFAINLITNILWSFLFFKLQNPLLAFFDILVILITIFAMIFTTCKISKTSAFLLIPYLLWVGFASFLNLGFLL